ncbi:UNVERIFIED_CONTAM: Nucleoporin NDC1, partial [Siphonaria sp. JEL0065]
PLDLDTDPTRLSLLLATLKPSTKSSLYETTLAFEDLLRLATFHNARARDELFNGTGIHNNNPTSILSTSTPFSTPSTTSLQTENGTIGGASAYWIEVAASCVSRIESLQKRLTDLQQESIVSKTAKTVDVMRKSGITSLKFGGTTVITNGGASPSPIKKVKLLTGAVKPSPVKKDVVGSFLDALQDDSAIGGATSDFQKGITVGGPNGLYKVGGGGNGKKEPEVGVFEAVLAFVGASSSVKKKGVVAKRDGMRKMTRDAFVNYEVLVLAVQCISKLLIAGTKEDKYGSVQRDIPVVLECLINCLIAVETHISKPPGELEGGKHGSVVLREPLAMIHVLQTNIYYITTNLGDHLARYKFEPGVAVKLKRFLDYLE